MDEMTELPPGFRFSPTDEELLVQYLYPKVAGRDLSLQIIADIDLSKFDPWLLPCEANFGDKEWYFFSTRHRPYPNGSQPCRLAVSGYWKATGTDKVIRIGGRMVGIKKAMVFYVGKAPKGNKTNWIIHEYRLLELQRINGISTWNDWVLCRVYHKKSSAQKAISSGQTTEQSYCNSLSSSSNFDDVNLESLLETEDQFFNLPRVNSTLQQEYEKLNLQNFDSGNYEFDHLVIDSGLPGSNDESQSLSYLLERSPTPLDYWWQPESPDKMWGFWSKNEGSENNSSSAVGTCNNQWQTATFDFRSTFCRQLSFQEVGQKAGLDVFNVQEQIPYKTINGLTPTKDEIKHGLEIVCKSHNLCLAQVWTAFEDKSHVPLSTDSDDTQRILRLKLTSYLHDICLQHETLSYYEDFTDKFPLGTEDEHVLKTLQDFKPRYISKLHDDFPEYCEEELDYDHCAFAICLRSLDTSDFSYVFQYIWPKYSRCDILLEAILLTTKRCLPSFKFASGVELGDELDAIEVGCSEDGQTCYDFKLFQGKRLSPTPNALEKGKQPIVVENIAPSEVTCTTTSKVLSLEDKEKQLDVICVKRPMGKTMVKYKTAEIILTLEDIEKHYDKPMKEAAKILNVSESTLKRKLRKHGIAEWPKRAKRNKSELSINQIDSNEEDNGAAQKPSTIIINAEYAGYMIKISHLNSQATFETINKEIGMRFSLSFGTYNLTYLDEDEDWILFTSDEELCDCIKSLRKSDRIVIRVRVLPSTNI